MPTKPTQIEKHARLEVSPSTSQTANINFDSVKHIAPDPKSGPNITITNPSKICSDKRKRKIYNRKEEKTYQMVYTKRRRVANYDTVPYGY